MAPTESFKEVNLMLYDPNGSSVEYVDTPVRSMTWEVDSSPQRCEFRTGYSCEYIYQPMYTNYYRDNR